MKVTKAMIEVGARALAEWSAPNWGGQHFDSHKNIELDNAYRTQARVVLEAVLNPERKKL